MTLFSYLMAALFNQQFREPELLNLLIKHLSTDKDNSWISKKSCLGWMIHYLAGFVFAFCFVLIAELFKINWTLSTAVFFGLGSGVVGVGFWIIMILKSLYPPEFNLTAYSGQLIIAHILFASVFMLTAPFVEGAFSFNY